MAGSLPRVDDPDQVRAWISAAESEVEELAKEADLIQYKLARARKRLVDLYELLAAATQAPVAMSQERLGLARSVRERVLEATDEILRAVGRPLSVAQIHAEFVRRGYPLPGRGTPTNIVAHLITSDHFVKRSRGVYALAEWAGDSEVAGKSSQ